MQIFEKLDQFTGQPNRKNFGPSKIEPQIFGRPAPQKIRQKLLPRDPQFLVYTPPRKIFLHKSLAPGIILIVLMLPFSGIVFFEKPSPFDYLLPKTGKFF